MASQEIVNMLVSAPFMIIGGLYLPDKIGSKGAMKFWQMSLLCCFVSLWVFGPFTPMFDMHLREYFPFSCDGINAEKRGLLAADLMAGCLLYLWFKVYELDKLMALWFLMDLAYYGPMAFAMPVSVLWYWYISPKSRIN